MQRLDANIYSQALSRTGHWKDPRLYLPDDGLCTTCHRLLRDHPGVIRALAAVGLAESPGLPYCFCRRLAAQEDDLRRQWANLPRKEQTFDNFIQRPGAEEALAAAQAFAQGHGEPVLVIGGIYGSGKTHLLNAIGRALLAQEKSVRYDVTSDLLDKLRATYGDDAPYSFDQVMNQYRRYSVLLLDDLGMEQSTEWAVEKLTALIDERYRNLRRLAVATNLTYRQMYDVMPRLASRLWDTQSGTIRHVTMTCTDYRRG